MTKSVHGHEVLNLMLENQNGFTRESLKEAIVARFGADARYYTCSAQGMTAEELIDFLSSKGKFVEGDGGFNTRPDMICSHH